MNVDGKESEVFKQASLDEFVFTKGLGSKSLNVDTFIYNYAHHGNTKATYKLGLVSVN